MYNALLEPCRRKTLKSISNNPTTRTSSLLLFIRADGRNSLTSFNLPGMAGVMDEIILTIPSEKIINGGSIRRTILFFLEIKLQYTRNNRKPEFKKPIKQCYGCSCYHRKSELSKNKCQRYLNCSKSPQKWRGYQNQNHCYISDKGSRP